MNAKASINAILSIFLLTLVCRRHKLITGKVFRSEIRTFVFCKNKTKRRKSVMNRKRILPALLAACMVFSPVLLRGRMFMQNPQAA